jgi:uncharacterized protein YggE
MTNHPLKPDRGYLSRFLLVAAVLALLFVAATSLSGSSPARAAQAADGTSGGITVNGSGSVSAVPTRAQWSFTVAVTNADASQAFDRAAAKAATIAQAVRAQGIADKDIQTSSVSLSPNYANNGIGKITGYTASVTIDVKTSIKASGQLVNAAVKAGANQVSGPSLSTEDTESFYKQALKVALDQAKSRAQALAAAAGVALGAPTAISIDSSGPVTFAAADAKTSAVTIEPGQQDITASVTVTYAIR